MNAQKISLIIFLVLLAEALNVGGQYLFKKTTNQIKTPDLKSIKSQGLFFKEIFLSFWIWLGLIVMTAGLGVWVLALSQGELSFVFSLGSLQCILILLVGHFFLGEKITSTRVAGTLLVICGVILVSIS